MHGIEISTTKIRLVLDMDANELLKSILYGKYSIESGDDFLDAYVAFRKSNGLVTTMFDNAIVNISPDTGCTEYTWVNRGWDTSSLDIKFIDTLIKALPEEMYSCEITNTKRPLSYGLLTEDPSSYTYPNAVLSNTDKS